jgi:glycosyltransferase involved in cell wall biosynthesis
MLLADEYRPDPRVRKEALALHSDGHEVTIISWDRLHKHEVRSNMEGMRIEWIRTGKVGVVREVFLNYPSFMIRCLARSRGLDFDVVHAHDLDTLVIGQLISRLRGVPLVYDAHEQYAAMVANDVPPVVGGMFDRIEAICVGRIDLLITVSSMIEEHLRPNLRCPSVLVMNCIDLQDMQVVHESHDGVMVFYSGSMEPTRYVERLARAVLDIDDCRYKVAGKGPLRPVIEEMARSNERIIFLGYLPHDELLASMSDVDLVACLLDPSNENNRIGMPNKLFESMALEIPLLVSKGTLSAEVAMEEGCGIVISWSEEEFREAVDRVRDPEVRRSMGENGRKAALVKYNWEVMKERLIEAYRSLR